MSQSVENIKANYPLFMDDDYQSMLENKQQNDEERHPQDIINKTFEWTTTEDFNAHTN